MLPAKKSNKTIRSNGSTKRRQTRAIKRASQFESLEQRLCMSVTYASAVNYTLPGVADFVTSADFNGDGKKDLVTSNYANSNLSFFAGGSSGTFGAASNISLSIAADFVTSGDLNGDGKYDLVTVSYSNNTVGIMLGNGNGTFATPVQYAAGTGPRAAVLGDFNNDGKIDLAIAKSFDNNLTILRGNGNGTFQSALNSAIGFAASDLVAGDFNADGNLDLAAANYFGDKVRVLIGNGNATFATAVAYTTGAGPTAVTAADFNGDGILDLATANFSANTISVLRGNANGTFQTAASVNVGTAPTYLASADLDGSGTKDLVVVNSGSNNVSALFGTGSGTFSAAVNYTVGNSPRAVALGDFKVDSAIDIAVTNQGLAKVSVLLGNGVVSTTPTAVAGGPYSVSEGGTVALDGSASIGAGLTYTWDLDGDGTFGETGAGATRGNETGATPTFNATNLDGTTSYTITLRITNGTVTDTDTAIVTVNNVAPTLTLTGASSITAGETYTLTLAKSDVGPDTISQWVINWGDGTSTTTLAGSATSATHVFSSAATRTITATATDEDGSYNKTKSVTVIGVPVDTYLSDMDPISQTNGHGNYERDKSNGEAGAGDGNTITLNGVTYTKGLGVHAASELVYNIFGQYTRFVSDIGLDDEVGANGNAIFQVWGDGVKLYDSGAMTGSTATKSIDVDITGVQELTLTVLTNGEYDYDHADWADAQILVATGPVARAGTTYTVAEGSTVALSGASSTGTGLTYAWDLDGDGIFGETGANANLGNETGATPTFNAGSLDGASSRTITLRVTDINNVTSTATATVNITNVAPTLTLGGAASVNEGAVYTLTFGATDPGSDTITGWSINWGDGTTTTYAGNVTSATHIFADNAARTITATTTDEDGSYSATKAITVNNVAPTATLSGNASVDEGSAYTLNLAVTDPGTDTVNRWVINWGDGNTQTINSNPSSVTHTYADNGSYTISATVRDEDGTFNSNSLAISVNNVAPTLGISGNNSVNEGSNYTLSLSKSDVGTDTISGWTIDWGDGISETIAGTATSKTHNYADNGAYTISASATDEDGTYSAGTKNVTVNNVAPTITISGARSVVTNQTYTLTLAASDVGDDTISQWSINWGDGNIETIAGDATSATHVFATNGSFSVSAVATDEDGTYNSNTKTVDATDVPPTFSINGTGAASEGSNYTINFAVSGAGADSTSGWMIEWGDGGVDEYNASATSANHIYADDGNYQAQVIVTNVNGTFFADLHNVAVSNVAPTVATSGSAYVNLGSEFTLSLSATDAGSDTVTQWFVDWGDGTTDIFPGNPSSVTKTYAAVGNYTITATAVDEDGSYSAASRNLLVAPLAPAVDSGGNLISEAPNLGDVSIKPRVAEEYLGVNDRSDYYKVTFTSPVVLTVKVYNLLDNVDLMILDADGNRIAYSKHTGTSAETLIKTLQPGTYFIHALFRGVGATTYRLRMEAAQPGATPPPASGDGTIAGATNLGTLAPGAVSVVAGTVADNDLVDMVKITLGTSRQLYIKLTNMTADTNLTLLNSAGQVVATSARAGISAESLLTDVSAGVYYIKVSFNSVGTTPYRLRVAA